MLETQPVEGSALLTTTTGEQSSERNLSTTADDKKSDPKRTAKGNLVCNYCKKPGHTKDTCYKLHGRPQNMNQPNRNSGRRNWQQKGQAHVAQTNDNSTNDQHNSGSREFNKEDIDRLRSLLDSLEKPSGSCSLALSGMCSDSLVFSVSDNVLTHPNFWIVDSGATDHMTNSSKIFSSYKPCPSNKKITIADGNLVTVAGQGDISLGSSLFLKNVLHVPKLANNLISVKQITKDMNCNLIFSNNSCEFQDRATGRTIGHAKEKEGLYCLETRNGKMETGVGHSSSFLSNSSTNKDKILLLHFQLGHPAFRTLNLMFPSLFKNVDLKQFHCDICELAKHKRASFSLSNNKSSVPFYLIHSDVWGPSRVANHSGTRWFVIFIDDCTRVTWTFLMRQKSDVANIFPKFHNMIKTQFGVRIKRVRTDNGKEYFNQTLSPYFSQEGIVHESSCIDTAQQNGVAERKNGHLLETTRALLFQRQVPKYFWGEAVLTPTHLINQLPTKVLNFKSPWETLSHHFPDFRIPNRLPPRVFGCVVYAHIHAHNRSKLDPRALKCMFIGYSSTQKGYKCYHPPTRKTYVSIDVTFVEHESYFHHPSPQGEATCDEKDDSRVDIFDFMPELSLPSSQVPHLVPFSLSSPTSGSFLNPDPSPTSPNPSHPDLNPTPNSEPNGHPHEDPAVSPPENPTSSINPITTKPLQVYSRKKGHKVDPKQAQKSDPMLGKGTNQEENTSQVKNPIVVPDKDELDIPIAIRKGIRKCTQHPLSHFVSFEKLSSSHKAFLTHLNTVAIPKTLSEALNSREWKQAMKVEMEALEKNKTWEMVELPMGKRPVGCKWVFSVKYNADGSLERYKARLVAKGYTQTFGVDYQETFAPVAKMNTVRVLLSLAATYDWTLQQLDVKNAFLHGDLEEEIYMEPPPGFVVLKKNVVCRLRKALYGLKQSPRARFGRFARAMLAMGYKQSQGDHTLFIKRSSSGGVTALIVYVDDIIVTGNNQIEMKALKAKLAEEFEIKDLGKLKYFLGIEVAHSKQGIFISQQKYVTDLLKETGKTGCRPVETPIEPNHKLGEAGDDEPVDKGMYQRLVGRLIYLSHTRPDIAYAVNVVSQFMHNPKYTSKQCTGFYNI